MAPEICMAQPRLEGCLIVISLIPVAPSLSSAPTEAGVGRRLSFIHFRAAAAVPRRTMGLFLTTPEICMAQPRPMGRRAVVLVPVASPLSLAPTEAWGGLKPRFTISIAAVAVATIQKPE